MYKFVSTLTDTKPWIDHFKQIADTATPWKPTPEQKVVVLKKTIKNEGVEQNKKVDILVPVEQVSEQAKAELVKDLTEYSQTRKRKNTTSAKKTATKVAKKTKDIFSKYREKKNGR